MFLSFIKSFLSLYMEMVPYLAFGLFVAGILHVTVNKSFILNHFGNHGILSVIKAAVLGVPLPLCSCSVVPTGLSLKKHGASNGATLSFLISTPQTGVESIAATWGMMGPFFALFRPMAAFITGIIGGALSIKVKSPIDTETESASVETKKRRTPVEAIKELFHYGFVELMDDIGFNLLVGVLISAVITVFIPESFFTSFTGNPLLEMVVVLLGAVPLYVCATASIPIAAALLIKGVSPGAAFVFLMAGPATNAATISVLFSKLGRTLGSIYLSVIVVSSLVFGAVLNWGYDYFNVDVKSMFDEHAHHHMEEPSAWLLVVVIVFTSFLIWSIWKTKLKVPLIRLFRKRVSSHGAPVRVYAVGGVTCNNCAGHVSDAAKLLEGVADASVNAETGELTVIGDVDESVVRDAVNKAGYSFDRVLRGTDIVQTVGIEGMSCNNCVRHVTEAIIEVEGVTDVVVDLEKKSADITGNITLDSISSAVHEAGYTVIEPKNEVQ